MAPRISLCVLTLFIVCEGVLGGCTGSWKHYGNSCYYFSYDRANWLTARDQCRSWGSNLVKISSAGEDAFLFRNLRESRSWIGLTDRSSEGIWYWVSDYSRVYYTNWYSGEPNDLYGEDCGETYRQRWNDRSCWTELPYICEKPQIDCGRLTQPAGGRVAVTTTTYGSTATYSCDTGYDLNGRTSVTCQSDGYWETLPTCNIKDCGSLTQPADGSVTVTTTTYTSTATYSCNTGYDLNGATTVICQADGTWETLPTCDIKDCGYPTAPIDGDVTFTTSTYTSVATFTCDTGYIQDGTSSATCLDTGVWSGSPPTCTIVDCGRLTQPADGSVAVTTTTYGSTATYSCDTGYDLNGATIVICKANGTWEDLPTCEADVTFVCNPNNTIEVYGVPPGKNCYAMQDFTTGTSTQCTITRVNDTTVYMTGCSKDVPILFSFGTYSGMQTFQVYGGHSLTTIKIQCSEIPEAGNIHSVNTSFNAMFCVFFGCLFGISLELAEEAEIDPTYDVTSSLNTTSTIVGYPVLWTISFPVEYILEVSNCRAYPGLSDSSSLSISLISSGGCNMEAELISDFLDNLDGTVTTVLHAFKFYEAESVFLQCSVVVCPDNEYQECDTSCSRTKRTIKEVHSGETRRLYRGSIQNVLRVTDPSSTASTVKVPAFPIGVPLILALLAVNCL